MEIVFFIVAATASAIGAMSGIGGGVIIKPVMDALQVMDISSINFLSGWLLSERMIIWGFNRNAVNAVRERVLLGWVDYYLVGMAA